MSARRKAATAPPVGTAQSTLPAPRASDRRWTAARTVAGLYAAVALGSMLGGVLRWLAGVVVHDYFGAAGFPWATLFVNVTGSFAIGFYAALTGPDGRALAGPRQRQFVMTGVCGGYTTFSIFSLETLRLMQSGDLRAACLNVGISVVVWLAAVWFGYALPTRLSRLKGS
jgi:CrcB protein